ncbi:MAG: hypothetical protein IPM17_10985 [Verrucomicrobia bacterium]|nr:hypothetical protein [Verrucomicrobiota bacterium]
MGTSENRVTSRPELAATGSRSGATHHRRPFRHKHRRYHYHPAALGHPEAADDDAPVSRRGVLWTAAVLLVLSAPFALTFLMALLLGSDDTRRWLSTMNAEWLAPWLR